MENAVHYGVAAAIDLAALGLFFSTVPQRARRVAILFALLGVPLGYSIGKLAG